MKGKVFKSRFGEMTDARLKTTPKGYDAENPAINYLRQTSFTVMASIKDKDLSGAAFTKEAAKAYKEMLPFLKFFKCGSRLTFNSIKKRLHFGAAFFYVNP
ncbi:MAG: DUF2461 family protein [Bacteroidetes bacterium]|nr:DUF2461 family protein [Bacteroidota bacterium]